MWNGKERRSERRQGTEEYNELKTHIALVEQKVDLTLSTINERFNGFEKKFAVYNNVCSRTQSLETKTESIQHELAEHKADSKEEKKEDKDSRWRWTDTVFTVIIVLLGLFDLIVKIKG